MIAFPVQGTDAQLLVALDGAVELRLAQSDLVAVLPKRHCRWWRPSAPAKAFQVDAGDLVGATLPGGLSLRIWSCPLQPADCACQKRTRQLVCSPLLRCASDAAAAQAVALLQRLGSWRAQAEPPRLLVIINPRSGQGRGKRIYERQVAPILAAAGLEVAVADTLRRGHAGELAARIDLRACDLLVLVGGDGTVFDALQGLLQRPDWADAARLPLCQVPGGSGNALAANCGLWSPVTAAHAICKGRQRVLDIVSVLQPPGRRYYAFLSIVFGMVANLDRGTEHLRWLGGARFTVGLLQQILLRTAFEARVAFLPPGNAPAGAPAPHAISGADVALHACSGLAVAPLVAALPAEGPGKGAGLGCPPGPPTPLLDALGPVSRVDPLDEASLPPKWRTLGPEKVALFAACNLPWLDFKFDLAPEADFDTGHLDLLYTRVVTRREAFEFSNHCKRATHLKLPMCGFEKVAALVLEPVSKGTWLLLDGEEVAYERIYAEDAPAHPVPQRLHNTHEALAAASAGLKRLAMDHDEKTAAVALLNRQYEGKVTELEKLANLEQSVEALQKERAGLAQSVQRQREATKAENSAEQQHLNELRWKMDADLAAATTEQATAEQSVRDLAIHDDASTEIAAMQAAAFAQIQHSHLERLKQVQAREEHLRKESLMLDDRSRLLARREHLLAVKEGHIPAREALPVLGDNLSAAWEQGAEGTLPQLQVTINEMHDNPNEMHDNPLFGSVGSGGVQVGQQASRQGTPTRAQGSTSAMDFMGSMFESALVVARQSEVAELEQSPAIYAGNRS
ncbi:hypothetical protein WJX81_004306 [Elliptochloris bilobata]|uniref:DAGKc domain-containing protein n=1 Tax=Elliptochloris bilobata TaxID=381761 RepID=A0AAW1RNW2_9CHLO